MTDKRAILVVDDDPQSRKGIGEVFRGIGYPCEEASNGFEALKLLRKEHFDIVLCDIQVFFPEKL